MLIISCCYISENDLNTNNQDYANIIYANSCSSADIQAAHDSANDGDLIMIPTGDCTWDSYSEVNVTKAVSFIGAGSSQTILRKSTNSQFYGMFDCYFSPELAPGPTGITFAGMKLVGEGSEYEDYGIWLHSGYRDFRIYDCVFENFGGAGIAVDGRDGWGQSVRQPWGVIYNCSFIDCYKPGYGYGVLVMGDDTWEDPLVLGDDKAVFVEDCYFSGCRHAIASNAGSKYVFRFNTITINKDAAYIDAHGKNLYDHGSRSWEIYENDISHPVSYTVAIGIRGGDGVVFNNAMTNFSGNQVIYFVNEICPGCGGYPCADQVREAYIWENKNNGLPINGVPTDCQDEGEYLIREDRDIFNYEKPGYVPYIYPHPLRWRDFPLKANLNASPPSGYGIINWLWPGFQWQANMPIFK